MIQQIKKLLQAIPFEPFKIRTSDGREYLVPTVDHAKVAPNNARVVVFDDEGLFDALSGLHIASIEGPASVAHE